MSYKKKRVVFRVWPKRAGGDVVALFPNEPATVDGQFCTCYQHLGQHGAADYDRVIAQTRPATADEYAPLLRELEQVGYTDDLDIRKRR